MFQGRFRFSLRQRDGFKLLGIVGNVQRSVGTNVQR